ncbi:hypothetical protein DNK48_10110 [Streptomyces malaysiensis subsp. malaysiensis]|nr:hypothetical protein DNK48_10110 [Streptomyces malaysiensis]
MGLQRLLADHGRTARELRPVRFLGQFIRHVHRSSIPVPQNGQARVREHTLPQAEIQPHPAVAGTCHELS